MLRRAILTSLYNHLKVFYGIEWRREAFVDGQLSHHDIDALLAFKTDPRLDELRGALNRLEEGTYGQCLACKNDVSQELLDRDPARRFCPACEQQLAHRTVPCYGVHAPFLR